MAPCAISNFHCFSAPSHEKPGYARIPGLIIIPPGSESKRRGRCFAAVIPQLLAASGRGAGRLSFPIINHFYLSAQPVKGLELQFRAMAISMPIASFTASIFTVICIPLC